MGKGGLTRHDLQDGGLSKRRRTTSGAVPRAAAVRMLREWTAGNKVSRHAADVMTRDTLEELLGYMRTATLAADGKRTRAVRWSARAVRDMVTAHGYIWPTDDAAA